jgi:CsoR family transcriptional regulator, copper-sensing transcriptional repressor
MASEKRGIDNRLARIEGQVRGVRRMVADGDYCVDVLNQLSAVRAALNQVAAELATQHIQHCIAGHDSGHGHERAQGMTQEQLLDELREVLGKLAR